MNVRAATSARGISLRLPAGLLLAATVGLATLLHVVLALKSPAPWVVPDEIRHSELAKSLATGLPEIRGRMTFEFGLGYPALLAPTFALFDDVSTAYAVAKALNAFVLGLTALPAYFLARRFLDEARALVVSLLTVSVPSLLYAGTLMTEVALYPAFVLSLLAIALALDRPSRGTQIGALSAIALASSVKLLAAALVVGYVAAILLFHGLETRRGDAWRARLRAYGPSWVGLAAIAVALGGATAATGRSPLEALGTYEFVLRH
ncbi:MAG TPA: glycosyltransferase family 39 protein, partial [Dehalococcoidia bacterium]|nr:glycosyltransferase family 39 protein [Dehalococcoidia bacterium]